MSRLFLVRQAPELRLQGPLPCDFWYYWQMRVNFEDVGKKELRDSHDSLEIGRVFIEYPHGVLQLIIYIYVCSYNLQAT